MTNRDRNNVRVKPGHDQSEADTLPFGEHVWLLRRRDDKLYGVWTSRHDAVGAACLVEGMQEAWLEPIRVQAGTVRLEDIVILDRP